MVREQDGRPRLNMIPYTEKSEEELDGASKSMTWSAADDETNWSERPRKQSRVLRPEAVGSHAKGDEMIDAIEATIENYKNK